MDYVLNVILVVVGAFLLLSVALLCWVIYLLARITELERELRKVRLWHESWMGSVRRKQRLDR